MASQVSESYAELERVAERHGLTLTFEFVPQHFPEGTKACDMSMKWIVNVLCNGKHVLTTDYTQGSYFCPSRPKGLGNLTVADVENIRRDCATQPRSGQPVDPLDALWGIARDCQSVEQARGFEDWANEFGYDTDSRKAEAIYRTCVDQWKALRHYIGDEGIDAIANVER